MHVLPPFSHGKILYNCGSSVDFYSEETSDGPVPSEAGQL